MIGAHWPALLLASGEEPFDSVERRLERALAAACAVAWEWDVGTGESSLSAGSMALLSLKDHPTNGSFALVHPADRDWLQQVVIKSARGELPYDFEFRLLRPDGEVEWVRDRGQLERDPAGRPLRLAGVAQLITDQKRTEAAYAATFEQAAVGMAHVALNGAFRKVNDTLCRIAGRTREALLRLSFQDITHPDDLDAGVAQANDLLAGRVATYSMEKRYIRPDGAVVWIKLTVSLMRDAAGRPDYFISVMDDIGERKRAETAQHRSEARFRALVEASSQAVWRASPSGEGLVEDRGWAALTGQSADQKAGWGWLETIHPEDRAGTEAAWRQAVALQTPFALEHRVLLHDGTYRNMVARAVPVPAEDGSTREWVGSHGVADRRGAYIATLAAQDALAELQSVYDTAPVGLCVLDAETRWIRINRRMAEINGLPVETHIGRRVRDLLPGVADQVEARHRLVMQTGEPALGIEIVGHTLSQPGVTRTWMSNWFPLRDADSRVVGVNVVTQEVTEQRAAEEQQRRLLRLIETCTDFIAIMDADGRYTYINRSGRCMVGLDDDADLDNVRFGDFVAPVSQEAVLTGWLSEARDCGVCEGEVRLIHPRTGAMTDVHRTVFALRDREGVLTGYATIKRDVTTAKAAAAALAESEARFRGTFEQAAVGFAHVGLDGRWLRVNGRLCDLFGYTETELLERSVQDLTYPDDLPATLDNINRLLAGDIATYTIEKRYIRKDGSPLWADLTASLLHDGAGAPKHFIAVVEDISHRMGLEATLRAFYEISPLLMGTLELAAGGDLVRLHSNPAANRFTGGADGITESISTRAAGVPEKVIALVRARAEEAIAHGKPVAFECIYPTAAGPREIAATIAPLPTRGPAGGPTIFYVSQDITERHAAEARLAESEARLRLATEAGQVGVFDWNLRTNELRWDARLRAMWAVPPGAPTSVETFCAGLHPDDRERVVTAVAASLRPASGGFHQTEYRVIGLADGVERVIAARGRVSFESEQAVRMLGTAVDVTAQRRADAVLARGKADLEHLVEAHARDLRQTHARLAQAEKLAALGQLAGGIAHDFNNVLQAVQGAAEMIRVRPNNQAATRRNVEIIEEVARRGTAVTQRMLTFARRGKRQTEPVDPAAALAAMRDLLRHALGSLVAIVVEAEASLPPVLADKEQLETVLVNLATNARDAMPNGGTLTLSAMLDVVHQNGGPHGAGRPRSVRLQAGSYVRLSVADTGIGMTPAMLARVTEPFFTTKPEGRVPASGWAWPRTSRKRMGAP